MATKLTCHNLNCEHNNIELDTCENESIVVGESGVCCEVRSREEQQEDQEAEVDTTEQ